MKLLLVLCAVIALTTAAPEAAQEETGFERYDQEAVTNETTTHKPLKKGIYFIGNGRFYRINTDGTYVPASPGGWAGTTCMATYNGNRIFAVQRNNIYEAYEGSWKSFGSGYSSASALVQLGQHMFTTIGSTKCGRLYRITIKGTTATKEPWGSTGIYPLGLTTVYGGQYIIGAQTHWTLISPQGDGYTMNPGSCTAITTAPNGGIYAITPEGEIHLISGNGGTGQVVTKGDLFKGTRGITWFDGYLYAIGKNGRFYRINVNTGEATIQGTSRSWEVAGKMSSIQ